MSGLPAAALLAAVAGAALLTVPDTPTTARTPTGEYISWKEHLVDDESLGGVPIRGSDGLQIADFDGDGILDIVSVHEDSNHVRLAFGSKDPDRWHLATLADGKEAPAAEDAAVGDVNGDGHVDILVACELAHLIYFQNPGRTARTAKWPRAILENTRNRGSFIRAFLSDLDGDGKLEAIAANKGEQLPSDVPGHENPLAGHGPLPVSWFEIPANPLDPRGWKEHELIRLRIPINSLPVDIDSDGDMDVIAGSRGERRMVVLENQGSTPPRFASFPVKLEGLPPGMAPPWGFMIVLHDFSGDGRRDLLVSGLDSALMWLEQPTRLAEAWKVRVVGSLRPDAATGIAAVDINSDGRADVITGGYSQEPRDHDGVNVGAESVVGRIAWFENPGSMDRPWTRHDVSRTKRGMYDAFVARDMDGDGDVDFVATRGNSGRLDGVFWLEQVRSNDSQKAFRRARVTDSEALPLPAEETKVR